VTNRTTKAAPTRLAKDRKVIHASCAVHHGPAGFANVVVSKCDGTIEPMSTLWAICPAEGRTHVLRPVGDHPSGMLQAQCGHLLPWGVALHECLPGLLCMTCLWCYLVPAPPFPYTIPAGLLLSDACESTLGGQPVPVPAPLAPRCRPLDGTSGSICPGVAGYRGSPEGVSLGDDNRMVSTRPHRVRMVRQ
jgi:hypothetical protein